MDSPEVSDVRSSNADIRPTDVTESQEAKQPNSTILKPICICTCD